MTRLVLLLAVAAALPACIYKTSWQGPTTTTHERDPGPPRLVSTKLAGAGTLEGGVVVFELADVPTCAAEVEQVAVTGETREKKWFPGMVPYTVIGGAGAFGLYIAAMISISPDHEFGGSYVEVAGGAAAFAVAAHLYYLVAPRTKHRSTSRVIATNSKPARCDAAAAAAARQTYPTQLSLVTPWGSTTSAPVIDKIARFTVDWSGATIDPMSPEAPSQIRDGWTVRADAQTISWRPDPTTASAMVAEVGTTRGLDLSLKRGEAPPALAVVKLDAPDPILAGAAAMLSVTIENRGRGSGYRVVAVTKSSDPSLHGLRFAFGRVTPGESASRTIDLTLPRERFYKGPTTAEEIRVAVEVVEGNANNPDPVYHTVKVLAAPRPRMAVACPLPKAELIDGRYPVDAGRQLRLGCTLENYGNAAATAARIEVTLAGSKRVSASRVLAPGARTTVDVILQIPPSAQADDKLDILVAPAEDSFQEPHVSSLIHTTVRYGKVCDPGITREDYEARREGVRKQRAANVLSEEDARFMEDALLSCLSTR